MCIIAVVSRPGLPVTRATLAASCRSRGAGWCGRRGTVGRVITSRPGELALVLGLDQQVDEPTAVLGELGRGSPELLIAGVSVSGPCLDTRITWKAMPLAAQFLHWDRLMTARLERNGNRFAGNTIIVTQN